MSNEAIDNFMSWLDCKIESLTMDESLDDYLATAPTHERHQHEGWVKALKSVEDKAKKYGFITPERRGHGLNEEDKEVLEKIQAQKNYCQENKVPYFAPGNGICWKCRKQVYNAITMESASTQLITGCPYCHRSYCD